MIKQISDLIPAMLRDIPATDIPLDEWRAAQTQKALAYLRAKFPDVEEQAFYTDYMGNSDSDIVSRREVCDAADIDSACASCNGHCKLPPKFCARTGRPVATIETGMYDQPCLCVRWRNGIDCHYETRDAEFERLFQASGLTNFQRSMTFETYKNLPGTKSARIQALNAAKSGACLILAGNAGTGKTHLAVAIAIQAMRDNRSALFRLVSELVDELREANYFNTEDYYRLMRTYKNTSCLILDDMGKERTTSAGLDYVYQIVDYRYRNGFQTILTTNAKNYAELGSWGSPEYIVPIVSRIRSRGSWVSITEARDYRQEVR